MTKQRDRARHKGRRGGTPFIMIPHPVMKCQNWKQLSGNAAKLLLELLLQYNGRNNGDLTASRTVLAKRGWSVPETLHNASRELEHYGFIVRTKQGGLGLGPTLYAVSWKPVDECGGKLECRAGATNADGWQEAKPPFERSKKSKPSTKNCSSGTNTVPKTVAGRPH